MDSHELQRQFRGVLESAIVSRRSHISELHETNEIVGYNINQDDPDPDISKYWKPLRKPLTSRERMKVVELVIRLRTLLPDGLRIADLLQSPPESFQLCLLRAASPFLFRICTRPSLCQDEMSARSMKGNVS